jgi:hypothetical protein
MAESVVGLYTIECVRHESAFGGVDGLKLATLFWSPGLRHTRRARSGLLPHQYRGKVEVVSSSGELRWRPVNIRRRSLLDHRRCC